MTIKKIRSGITQAKLNDDSMNLFIFEIILLSIAVGIGTQSWWWFGGIFLGSFIIICIPILNIIFSIFMSILWGVIGYALGEGIGANGANWVIAIIATLIAGGMHMGAIEYAVDIDRED